MCTALTDYFHIASEQSCFGGLLPEWYHINQLSLPAALHRIIALKNLVVCGGKGLKASY